MSNLDLKIGISHELKGELLVENQRKVGGGKEELMGVNMVEMHCMNI
jgi:hypothetical protein